MGVVRKGLYAAILARRPGPAIRVAFPYSLPTGSCYNREPLDGTLASSPLDDSFHLRHDLSHLSAPMLVGVCMGAGLVLATDTPSQHRNGGGRAIMDAEQRSAVETQLEAHGQSHLLDHWDDLNETERGVLLRQIESIDWPLIARLLNQQSVDHDWGALAEEATTPPAIRLSGDNTIRREDAVAAGEAALRDGKVGVVLVAGGQGSRLGFMHPKGMYPIGPLSQRTLFQVHADRMVAAARRYNASLPLYLMTSPATNDETVRYFAENDNCGLEEVRIFCQGTMPAVDSQTGNVLLAEKGRLFQSPDGHGGTLAALDKSGNLDDMRRRGIEWLYYFQVDNPLVAVADAEFVGYHILSKSEMSSQVVAKNDPLEKVGVLVDIHGELRIIEYSDLPQACAERRGDDGELALWAGSIAIHVFDVAFLNRAKDSADALPFHLAKKKVPYVNDAGILIEPTEPNAIKFERFIFDLLPAAKRGIVVEVDPRDGFAPLKNAPGAAKDTEEFVKAAMVDQHRRWLQAAGAKMDNSVVVEINPKFAFDETELKAKIEPNVHVDEDRYFDE